MARRSTRSTAILLAAVAILFAAAACGDESAPTDEGATPTQVGEATATPPLPEATVEFYQPPGAEPVSAEVAQQFASLAPSEDEVDEALPDLAPFERQLAPGLGPEYEGIDLFAHGLVAGYTAFYRPAGWPANENQFAYVSFVLFGDAGGAGRAFEQMAPPADMPGTFEVAEGEEAGGYLIPASQGGPAATIVVLRQGRVAASLVLLQTDDQDRRGGTRQLAGVVADRIEAALPE
jgi:hypothetical protein